MRDPRWSLARRLPLLLLALPLACAVPDLQPDWEAARAEVRAATGEAEVLDPTQPPPDADALEAALADGLALDEAVRLALLNSRRLQAGFLSLGIARAEWVQAGLLQNPSLGLDVFFPSGGGRTRLAGELAMDVMDIWRLPVRRAAAAADYDRRVLELARQAADLVVEVRLSWCAAAAAREARGLATEGADLAGRSLAAAQSRLAAGAASEADVGLLRGEALAAGLQARRAEREEALALRRLAALLSLETDLLPVELPGGLPSVAASPADHAAVLERVRTTRLDLRAAAAAVAAADARLELERRRALPDVEAGLVAERTEGGSATDSLGGLGAGIELPLFDRNEAGIRRAEAERDELRALSEALLAEATQQALAATDRLGLAVQALAFVEGELLPQAERTLALLQRAHAAGDATSTALIEAQRAALTGRQALLDARLEAAEAEAELLRVLGAMPDGSVSARS